jgi:hypothetical protein
MRRHHWFRNGLTQPRKSRISRPRPPGRGRLRPHLEPFEDRTLLSSYLAATVADLIADINAANAAGGANTITLTAPTSNPYVLTAVDNTTDGANGLPVIAKKDTLRIIGNGDTIGRRTASGTPAFRLFDVASGASLTLENLTLQNGLAFGSGSASEGGAIYTQDTLVLSSVTVQGNVAQGSNGTTTQKGDGTPGNDAAGGGVWSNGTLTLENGTLVQNNQAIGGNGGNGVTEHNVVGIGGVGGDASGGGLYVAAGTAYVTGASISNNSAQGGAGGTWYYMGFGQAYGGNAFGGGIYVANATVSVSSDTVQNNSALGGFSLANDLEFAEAIGGGLYANGGTLTLSNDTVQYNSATVSDGYGGRGGGIYIASGATVSIDAFTVANTINNTDSSGFNEGTANIDRA